MPDKLDSRRENSDSDNNVLSAAKRTANDLRTLVLGMESGEFVGSEDELVEALGVSRPTFRQAAKLVEQEGLLVIKRGVGGGFFSQRPDSKSVSHMAAIYLQSREATLLDAIEASRPLLIEGARLAAERRDEATCEELRQFLKTEREVDERQQSDFREFLRSEREFGRIFARAIGNPLLELYSLTLYDFAASLQRQSLFYRHPDRQKAYRELRNQLAEMIVKQDAGIAEVIAERLNNYTMKLLRESKSFGLRRRKQVSRKASL